MLQDFTFPPVHILTNIPSFSSSSHLLFLFTMVTHSPPPTHCAQPTSTPVQGEVSQTFPHQTMENIRLLLLLASSAARSTKATLGGGVWGIYRWETKNMKCKTWLVKFVNQHDKEIKNTRRPDSSVRQRSVESRRFVKRFDIPVFHRSFLKTLKSERFWPLLKERAITCVVNLSDGHVHVFTHQQTVFLPTLLPLLACTGWSPSPGFERLSLKFSRWLQKERSVNNWLVPASRFFGGMSLTSAYRWYGGSWRFHVSKP